MEEQMALNSNLDLCDAGLVSSVRSFNVTFSKNWECKLEGVSPLCFLISKAAQSFMYIDDQQLETVVM